MPDELVKQAFEKLNTLPDHERERIAWEIIERVDEKSEWARLIALPESRAWLAEHAKKVLAAHEKSHKHDSFAFVSVLPEHLLRGGGYWKGFDELPDDIQKLAEKNYHLWQKEPRHPSLRFKQIHPDLPIFSFRAAMKYRAVGVRTDDGRIVWFWLGPIDGFKELVGVN